MAAAAATGGGKEGGVLGKMSSWLGVKKREAQVLVVGLDNSGKSTMLNRLKPVEAQATDVPPTVGFNVERFPTKLVTVAAWDMSGQGRYRGLWEQYYRETQGIVFVVDSGDRLRLPVARDEFWQALEHRDAAPRRFPVLLLANKMDEKGALSAAEVSQAIGIEQIKNKPWHVGAVSARTGDGLVDSIDWLAAQLKEYVDARR